MSKNTVKATLTTRRAKRSKRVVENGEFAGFTRRILAAYARRIATGDVEGLAALVDFHTEVDNLTRTTVQALRDFGYSWAEISARLGVTKQAAQQRFGNPTERGRLDRRVLDAGLAVTVDLLVTVFTEHHPGVPRASACPGCGHVYADGELDCPTNAFVRPILRRRRGEDKQAFNRLTGRQQADLVARAGAPEHQQRTRPSWPPTGKPAPAPAVQPDLFSGLSASGGRS